MKRNILLHRMLCVIVCCFCFSVVSGQIGDKEFEVAGVVLDEAGETMPGVSIYIKNEPGVGVVSNT